MKFYCTCFLLPV